MWFNRANFKLAHVIKINTMAEFKLLEAIRVLKRDFIIVCLAVWKCRFTGANKFKII